MRTGRALIAGALAVFCSAVLAVILEVAVVFFRWKTSAESQVPGMSVGIDILTLMKNRFANPSGLIAATVIFVLAAVFAARRGSPQVIKPAAVWVTVDKSRYRK